jgi:hypothetical protein
VRQRLWCGPQTLTDAIHALNSVLDGPARERSTSRHPDPEGHHDRVVRQLEHQAAMNAAFAQRSSMHASMLSVVAGIAEALTMHHNIEGFLPDIQSRSVRLARPDG